MLEKVKHKGLALAVLASAQFMVVLDATIVNVALPAVQKALGFTSEAQLQWIVTAYALLFGGFLLLGGRLADLFGRRKMFLAGVIVFAAASLLAGLAQDPTQIIVARALQGLGGAFLAPSALSLLLTIFKEGSERNKALGIWSIVAAGGGAVGLMLGGILTEFVDWRWIFFINIPVAAIIVAAALKYIPASGPNAKQKVDVLGAVTVTFGLMALVYALVKVPELGWTSSQTLAWFGGAALMLTAFVVNEFKVKNPLVKLSVFKRRNVTGGVLLQVLMPAALFGMFFYISIYLQQILGYSPTVTGAANLPFTAVIIVVSILLSRFIAKLNTKAILVIAPLFVAAGLLYFARLPVDANYWIDILPGIALMAGGMAAVFVTGTMVTTSGASHEESGLISGLINAAGQVGGAIGLAILTVVSVGATKDRMIEAMGNPAAMPEALVFGFQKGFMVAAIFAVAASVVALVVLKSQKPTKTDLKREAEVEAEAMPAVPGI